MKRVCCFATHKKCKFVSISHMFCCIDPHAPVYSLSLSLCVSLSPLSLCLFLPLHLPSTTSPRCLFRQAIPKMPNSICICFVPIHPLHAPNAICVSSEFSIIFVCAPFLVLLLFSLRLHFMHLRCFCNNSVIVIALI